MSCEEVISLKRSRKAERTKVALDKKFKKRVVQKHKTHFVGLGADKKVEYFSLGRESGFLKYCCDSQFRNNYSSDVKMYVTNSGLVSYKLAGIYRMVALHLSKQKRCKTVLFYGRETCRYYVTQAVYKLICERPILIRPIWSLHSADQYFIIEKAAQVDYRWTICSFSERRRIYRNPAIET